MARCGIRVCAPSDTPTALVARAPKRETHDASVIMNPLKSIVPLSLSARRSREDTESRVESSGKGQIPKCGPNSTEFGPNSTCHPNSIRDRTHSARIGPTSTNVCPASTKIGPTSTNNDHLGPKLARCRESFARTRANSNNLGPESTRVGPNSVTRWPDIDKLRLNFP